MVVLQSIGLPEFDLEQRLLIVDLSKGLIIPCHILESPVSSGNIDNESRVQLVQSLHESIYHTIFPLTHIINQSMSTELVPTNMKIAKVVPIFKYGNKHIFNNYRPISLLPAFSKLLEKVVATKLLKYLNSFDICYKQHSTLHPISYVIHLLNQIAEHNDKITKDPILAVFLIDLCFLLHIQENVQYKSRLSS